MAILFAVGNSLQATTADTVASHMSRASYGLNLETAEISPIGEVDIRAHRVAPQISTAARVHSSVRKWAQAAPGRALVVPQDVGLLYRAAIAAAKGAGVPVALMPDGAVSSERIATRKRYAGLLDVADAIARASKVLAGRHGVMGASRPDVCLSWGPGWGDVWRARGLSKVVDVGNPRLDDLSRLIGQAPPGTRTLIASQPMWTPNLGGWSTAVDWYEWLDRLASEAPEGALRVRLHPLEVQTRESLPVGRSLNRVLSNGSLSEDLLWSTSVVSWLSTTLIESAVCGRTVVSVQPTPAGAAIAAGYPFAEDPRLPRTPTGEFPSWSRLQAMLSYPAESARKYGEDYLCNVGRSASAAAQVLQAL